MQKLLFVTALVTNCFIGTVKLTPTSSSRLTMSNIISGEPLNQDGDVVDVFLQERRNGQAAKSFFNWLITSYRGNSSAEWYWIFPFE